MSAGRSRCGERLDQHIGGGNVEHLAEPIRQRLAGDDENPFARDQAGQTFDRLLGAGRGAGRGSNCFGFVGVLSGQKRVPEPPASSTAHLMSGRSPSEEGREGGAVLAEVAQERTDISVRRREDGEPFTRAQPSENDDPAGALEHHPGDLAAIGAGREPGGVLRDGRRKRRDRLGLEGHRRGMVDRQTIRRRQQDGLDAVRAARPRTTSERPVIRCTSTAGKKGVRNVGRAMSEVKKSLEVDPSVFTP